MNLFSAPPFLNRFQVEITTGCNLGCAGCQRSIGMAKGDWANRHMPVELFGRILANAPPSRALILQGIGEPTLHPRLEELCALAQASGKVQAISFNTNALARDPDFFAALKARGLSHLSISVDSLDPATAEKVRAGTDVARLRHNIAALIGLFEGRVTLSVVVNRLNLGEMPALLGELARLGGTTVEIQPMVGYSPESQALALGPRDMLTLRTLAAEARTRYPRLAVMLAPAVTPTGQRCRRPFNAAYVTVDGYLTPCCLTEDVTLFDRTSLAEQNFAQAWHGPGVSAWMQGYMDGTPEICRGCCYNPAGQELAMAQDLHRVMDTGLRHFTQNQTAEAEADFRRLLTGATPEALHRLGLLAHKAGQTAKALGYLRVAADLEPSPQLEHNLATVMEVAQHRPEAISLLVKVANANPDYEAAHRSLARMLTAEGKLLDAEKVLNRLLRRAIDRNNRALARTLVDDLAANALDPDNLILSSNLLRTSGWTEEAGRLSQGITQRHPRHLGAKLTAAMSLLPMCYDDAAQMQRIRQSYAQALQALSQAADQATPEELIAAAPQIGQAKPFYLSYQGENDRPLQELYGRFVCQVMAAADGNRPHPLTTPPEPGEKIRIGFASSYFRFHSVSKLFGGWIRGLDRTRFQVYGYDLDQRLRDSWGEALLEACDHGRHSLSDDAAWMRVISEDRLHAIIYPELGMDPGAVRLAARRLAPLQCATWGHPVTSGMPTLDAFLSSDLMEPENGQDHYTERLIRLPNLSITYAPLPPGQGSLSRETLGLRPDALVFICCQSLFKYRPQDDALFLRLAKVLPQAQFLFIGGAGVSRTEIFRQRLARAFVTSGLDFARHVVLAEPVPGPSFPAFLRLGDIYLDSLGWSGGNTTLEAAQEGLPILTLPGPLMRSRHSAAILRQMGLEDGIAHDLDDLVAKAVTLAEPAARAAASARMQERKQRLFGDQAPLKALEDFLIQAVMP